MEIFPKLIFVALKIAAENVDFIFWILNGHKIPQVFSINKNFQLVQAKPYKTYTEHC